MSGRSMVLIDQPELPVDAVVRFDVALADGTKLIRAEGRVLRSLPPLGSRPGGLQVKFTRFGASTKAFLDRAVALRDGARSHASELPPPARPSAPPPSNADVLVEPSATPPEVSPELSLAPPVVAAPPLEERPEAASAGSDAASAEARAVGSAGAPSPSRPPSPSHVRRKVELPSPQGRDEVLARLRARAARRSG